MRYFLTFAYNGTFHGWQRQPNASSVQQTLEEALSTLLRREIALTAAGRTDTGVHAQKMVAHFEADLSAKKEVNLVHLLNRYLDENIAIHDLSSTARRPCAFRCNCGPMNTIWGIANNPLQGLVYVVPTVDMIK